MITEYIKGDPVKVVDDEIGEYELDYQDNIDSIIELDNEIEMIEKKLEEMPPQTSFSKFVIKDTLYKGYGLLAFGITSLILCFGIAFVRQTFHILMNILPLLVPYSLLSVVFPAFAIARSKRRIKEEEIHQSQVEYLNEKLVQKREERWALQKDRTAEREPTNERVSILDIIEEKRALLLTELRLILEYKSNTEAYMQSYLNDSLDTLVQNEEEKAVVRRLIERDLRKAA